MRPNTLEQKTADEFAGLQIDQLQKLRKGSMTYEQIKWWNNLSYEQREQLMGKQPQKEAILKLISGAEELKLDAVDGKQTIANSKDVFSYTDPDFNCLLSILSTVQSWGLFSNMESEYNF